MLQHEFVLALRATLLGSGFQAGLVEWQQRVADLVFVLHHRRRGGLFGVNARVAVAGAELLLILPARQALEISLEQVVLAVLLLPRLVALVLDVRNLQLAVSVRERKIS